MGSDKTKKLGQLIRKTRKAQGLTQEQLAASAGVGIRFVIEVEQGKPSSQIGRVFVILDLLGLDINIGDQSL